LLKAEQTINERGKYIESLEYHLKEWKNDNDKFRETNGSLKDRIKSLERELKEEQAYRSSLTQKHLQEMNSLKNENKSLSISYDSMVANADFKYLALLEENRKQTLMIAARDTEANTHLKKIRELEEELKKKLT
jgi:chromosome segregation ATPase